MNVRKRLRVIAYVCFARMTTDLWTLQSDRMQAIRKRAIEVLRENDLGSCTLPSRELYPHQWNWDSAFTALGWVHIDPDRAWEELATLCEMAHPDGMIPHIAFAPGDGYFPGPEWWGAPLAHDGRRTSGITQPPVAGMCLRLVHEIAPRPDRLLSVASTLHRWHESLISTRTTDTIREPIVVHSWESGRDNAIDFDLGMHRALPTMTPFERADTRHVDAEHRPTDDEYQRYLGLVEMFRDDLKWDQRAMALHSAVRVLDPLFSATLARSCSDLAQLLDEIGDTESADQERKWCDQLCAALEHRASDDQLVRARNIAIGNNDEDSSVDVIDVSCGSPMILLIPGINGSLARAARGIIDNGVLSSPIGIRSASPSASGFSRRGYWRGPVWTNITWLCATGAKTQGWDSLARQLEDSLLRFVDEVGMREYAAPADAEASSPTGLGADDFTWTAALTLHILSTRDSAIN